MSGQVTFAMRGRCLSAGSALLPRRRDARGLHAHRGACVHRGRAAVCAARDGGGSWPPPPPPQGPGTGGTATERDAWQPSDYSAAPPREATYRGGQGPPPGGGGGWGENNGGNGGGPSNALLAGIFVFGVGAGVLFDSAVNLEPDNVASREIIDRQSPSAEICTSNGSSAIVFDQRLFLSFNPFNVYVTQPEVKPGCVLRRANWSVLERRDLVERQQVADCKRQMNTFAFVGDLDKEPEVSCVYHSEDAENLFMQNPQKATLGDGNVPRN